MSKEFSDTVANEIEALHLVESVDHVLHATQIVFITPDGVQHRFSGTYAYQRGVPGEKPTLILWQGGHPNAVTVNDLLVKGAC